MAIFIMNKLNCCSSFSDQNKADSVYFSLYKKINKNKNKTSEEIAFH